MAASVAAVIAAKERRIVERFREAGAMSAAHARTTYDVGISENIGFGRLRRHEVIREAGPGLFYLDEGVWTAVKRTRRRVACVVIAMVLLIFVVVGGASGVFSFR